MKKQGIRLSEEELLFLKKQFRLFFSSEDHLWIFGSRVDLNKRGGDLDLYIETTEKEVDQAIKKKNRLIIALWEQWGEQKIDVVLNIVALQEQLPIFKIAKEEGVFLL